ncbi:MAG: substrate-binding domain-containing protein, partial [Armatimonadetes bacterium]|nr:substrate-binding domain-containing protein [Armatimonadota bacterium]
MLDSRPPLLRLRPGFLLALLSAGLASGCGGGEAPGSGPPAGDTPSPVSVTQPSPTSAGSGKRVGVALSSMNHNFFLGMRQGVEEQLALEGFQADVVDADNSASSQQQQVEQLIQKGVSAIIMVPVDAQQAVNPVKAAHQAKIPIFCIDRRVKADGAPVVSTIETDNAAMGAMAARHGLELLCRRHKLDPGKPEDLRKLNTVVVHLWGLEAASSAQDRAKGFDTVFNSTTTPGVKILKQVGEFNARKSQEVLGPVLQANPGIELIFCHNDDNAIGALNAVKDVKKGREAEADPKRILIVGMDGNRAAIAAIRSGEIEATVSQEPIEMGRETVRQVKKV